MRAYAMLIACAMLAACTTAEPATQAAAPEQRLTVQERADLECARKRIEAGDAELEARVTEAIIAHDGKSGPVDLGEPCQG